MNNTEEEKQIILVVDDSPETVNMLSEALESQGYDILIALDGSRAVSVCKRIIPDLIIMDAIMPNMNGFEACRKIRENPHLSNVPVIFITGLDTTDNMISSFDSGAIDYIQKPIDLKELFMRIKVHINNSKQLINTQNILDQTGNASFACDAEGNLLWATPLAYEQLNEQGLNRINLSLNYGEFFKHCISSNSINETFTIKGLNNNLDITFKQQNNKEFIFTIGKEFCKSAEISEAECYEQLKEKFNLSDREAEVLFWLSKGKTNKEIALILNISPRTVNKHLENIFAKLMVENRTSAANIAINCLNSIK